MAKSVLRNAAIQVTVAGTAYNLSDHCSSVTLEDTSEEVDFTSFGSSNYREFGQGMHDASISADFFNDYVTGSVDSCLNACYTSSTAFTVDVWPNTTTTSSTNPKFTLAAARSYQYNPVAGAVGDANTVSGVVFKNAGTAGLTRATA